MIRSAPCPKCGTIVTRERVFFGAVEFFPNLACICDACAAAESQPSALDPFGKHLDTLPAKYRNAVHTKVKKGFLDGIAWKPGVQHGVGFYGPSNAGKSCAAAVLVMRLRMPFEWITGTSARQLSNDAATLDGREKLLARERLHKLQGVPLLVLDDAFESRFTEAWATNLFGLLEHRTSNLLPTIWTGQQGPGQISAKIIGPNNAIETSTADAIERRLVQNYLVCHAKP